MNADSYTVARPSATHFGTYFWPRKQVWVENNELAVCNTLASSKRGAAEAFAAL